LQQLSDTVDYTLIYELVRRQMNQPRKLLEELAQSILSEIHETFPQVTELKIHIEKTAPPVENFSGRLGIQLTRTF
jgi:dihydroneopterin aldolase